MVPPGVAVVTLSGRFPSWWVTLAAAGLLSACGAADRAAVEPVASASPAADSAAEQVVLQALLPGVWVHTSFKTLPAWGRVPSNGLLICQSGQGTLVDTAFTPDQTSQLLEAARARGCPVQAAVLTHHHDDRMGGLPVLQAAGIPTLARAQTVQLANVPGWKPVLLADDAEVSPAGTRLHIYYPGAGHTLDNAVVWLPDQQVLFGGCLVRALDNRALGNLQDADVAAWPATIARVIARYGSAAHVVPGHGAPGDAGLLRHTAALAAVGK